MSEVQDAQTSKLVERLARLATTTGTTVAVAESVTCGALVSALGEGSDASTWLAGGIVAYHTDVKARLLGVPDDLDPYSGECAEHLASGVRRLLASDVAVSTTGVGGPEPQGPHAPGTVYVGWDDGDRRGHTLLVLDGEPADVVRETVALCAQRLCALVDARREP
ncbi:CinA family protein [Serinibacter arcticus]|uniref:C-terminal domain of CinA type S n=1 Tax=Serinibacter arcticus TaxID=1655435 RepID=A0A4Z1E017_9MICO|nr:nicotinamide-nucleotide amidohydrolase family protein [Serinibacter arcticus]TGO03952.1 C-terminal domain of CinA type S [Serinibacter arcticus]